MPTCPVIRQGAGGNPFRDILVGALGGHVHTKADQVIKRRRKKNIWVRYRFSGRLLDYISEINIGDTEPKKKKNANGIPKSK